MSRSVTQTATDEPTTAQQQDEMKETLVLVLRLQERAENGSPPTAEEEKELARHFSDLAGLLSATAVISGETILTLGHILDVVDLIKFGMDLSFIGVPLMVLHLALRFYLLDCVSKCVESSEAEIDAWNGQYVGPHGELTTARREARTRLNELQAAVNDLVESRSGSVPIQLSVRLRAIVIATERALNAYDSVIKQSQKDLKEILGHAEDSKARASSMQVQGIGGVVTAAGVVAVGVGAVVATGGMAAVVGLCVGVAGVVGNGVVISQAGDLISRADEVLREIDQGQKMIDSHRETYKKMTEEVKNILHKAVDTIRREQAFLDQRRKAEDAEAREAEARAAKEEAERQAAEANAQMSAQEAELEQLRRMVARLQSKAAENE